MRLVRASNSFEQMKTTNISNSIACRATEIIALADISDVYNVSTGHDANEFIIRKIRHGTTLYFTSLDRDNIVKVGNRSVKFFVYTHCDVTIHRQFGKPRAPCEMFKYQALRGSLNSPM